MQQQMYYLLFFTVKSSRVVQFPLWFIFWFPDPLKWWFVMDVGVKLEVWKKKNSTAMHTLYCIFGAVWWIVKMWSS